ncbi:ABC transporter permease [Marinobacter persicus]|uniref:Transport permease protein n=1 Tax=Marinobacter persicus TaxID=930118 RepID=A0A2S6G2I0_9GAMM|nr:ABC transporter permease [Marinobacter persicus]PPK49980.1 lipopolysaccharide transport system permease protein [Marinobacter persicus]PPK51895.1 lipopolysaccharide transport system permease protein [Marinobacter persicus]PPK56562.1 lipopolysaccharide transport system permease protein [Marinobacter persicus]
MNPHALQPVSPKALALSCWQHRNLISQITRREVVGRYRGSMMGLGWSFLNPVLMLAVFTFVFSVVFQAKWGVEMQGQSEGKGVFAVVLFIGLIVHGLFAEVLTRSPGLIVGNVNYVKKVVFPLEILPVSAVLSALFHAVISIVVWFTAYLLIIGIPSWQIIFLPLVLLPLVVLSLGVSYVLASLGVFLRDVAQTMGILTTVLLFMSPVFFPIERLPAPYRPFFLMNPLTFIIEQARDVLVWHKMPDFTGLTIYLVCALTLLFIGYAWFQKTRKGFADVL